jgi:hypothetical protein
VGIGEREGPLHPTSPSPAQVLDDGSVRLTATTSVERAQLGVSGNTVGILGETTTLSADTVFRRAGQ